MIKFDMEQFFENERAELDSDAPVSYYTAKTFFLEICTGKLDSFLRFCAVFYASEVDE